MDREVLKELLVDLIKTMHGRENQSGAVDMEGEMEDAVANKARESEGSSMEMAEHGEGCECPECKMKKPAASITLIEEIGMKPRKKV